MQNIYNWKITTNVNGCKTNSSARNRHNVIENAGVLIEVGENYNVYT